MNERIKELRKSLKLTQAEFGKKIGVSDAAVSKMESGINTPSEITVKLICATFHVNYLWLTEGLGPMMEEEDTDAMVERVMVGESPLAISIMKAFVKLPDEEWIKFRDLVDKVKKEGLS